MPTLDQLAVGQRGRILAVAAAPGILQRILEMGLLEGEDVEIVAVAPFGDPIDVRVHGFQLSIRKSEAAAIEVEPLGDSEGQ